MRKTFFLPLLLALAACVPGCTTPRVITETEYVEVEVPVRIACPGDETYAELQAARPVPLRDQELERPENDTAALAIIRPQLGRYEAPGAFADQAMRIIDSCHREGVDGGLDPP